MAKITSREEFKQYCLRKLGHPVIQINVSDDQIEDRVTESLSFFADYHFNGSQEVYIKHKLTADDIKNGYITVPDDLIGVARIFDLNSSISSGSGMFNVTYQFVLNNLQDLTGFQLQNYYMTMQQIRFIEEILVGWPMIRYNRLVNKLYLDIDMKSRAPGNYVIVDAYAKIDEDTSIELWNDRWLQNYATVLIKEQWGSQLSKYSNMQLVGGVQFNGYQIYKDAIEERQKLEQECISNLQQLTANFSG